MGRPVVLALSTFRYCDEAVDLALKEAADGSGLVVVFVADQNLARYFIDSGALPGTEVRQSCEEEMLKEHLEQARANAAAIAARATAAGIECATVVVRGRFAVETLAVVRERTPRLVITTRSKRSDWVRRFFGSPVDTILNEAGCPVMLV